MKRGELHTVRADALTPSGAAVSQLAGSELYCYGLFPGEEATVRVDAVSRQHARAFASLVRRKSAHPARREAACQNHVARGGACGGCAWMELDEAAQREEKRAMLAARFGLVVREVEAAGTAFGYRHSSKRVALSLDDELVLGSYARESHAPAAMPGCLVDHPLLVQAFADVERAARALAITAYDERSGHGDLCAVWAKTNGQGTIVTLVVQSAEGPAAERLPERLGSVAGVLVSVRAGASNNLRGERALLKRGRAELSLALLGQSVEVGALGFLQPNPEVAALAYRALLTPATPHADHTEGLAFDLYAGAGVTTRALSQHYREVVACEAHPESAAALGITPETSETFLQRELAREDRREIDLVIANPPRKGLGPEVVARLRALAARELRIMSCGPEALARDLAALTAEGGYVLRALRAFDTLPQTPHVELVAHLEHGQL